MVCYLHDVTEKVTFKTGISLPPSLHEGALRRAKETSGGKFARYVQQLISADLANEPSPTAYDAGILSKLAKTYAGYLAPTIDNQLIPLNQPRLLHTLLTQLSDFLAAGGTPDQMQIGFKSDYNQYFPTNKPVSKPTTKGQYLQQLAAEDAGHYEAKSALTAADDEIALSLLKNAQHISPPTLPKPPQLP